jgi:hypothetical protein
VPPNKVRYVYGETRMLTEYLAWSYPGAIVWERLRLGPLQPTSSAEGLSPEELSMMGVFRRWADAVAVTRDELVLIEGKMRSEPGAVAQLLLYRDLVSLTPELNDYRDRRLVLELVVAVEDPAVRRLCDQQGIRHRVFRPDWLAQWSAGRHRREGRAPRDLGAAAVPGPL